MRADGSARWPALRAIRSRRLQALTTALLAAVITTCAVMAPLTDRSMRQALTSITLASATTPSRGIEISSLTRAESGTGGARRYTPTPLDDLARVLPSSSRRLFEAPIAQENVKTSLARRGRVPGSVGDVVWRSGACRHVRVVHGRCPTQAGDILVSAADARNFALRPGLRLRVSEFYQTYPPVAGPSAALRVVGVYVKRPGSYWFDHVVDGVSGSGSAQGPIFHDVFLTDRATLSGTGAPVWLDRRTSVDYRLDRPRVGVDQLLGLPQAVDQASGRLVSTDGTPIGTLDTSLGELTDTVQDGTAQGRVTVPLLLAQLGLLSAIVLAMVLAAATDQRRREIAVARLRGRSPWQAGGLVLGELAPPIAAGVVVGTIAAFLVDATLRHTLLRGAAPLEVRWPALAAALGASVVLGGLALWASRRVSRRPVAELLRQVPPRRSGRAVGIGDAVVVAAAGIAVVAFLSGDLAGPLAVIAPALVSLVAGVVLSYLVALAAARLGATALGRGRLAAVSLLAIARRPSTRRVVTIATVAAALVVFSSEAVLIGVRNRASAAEQTAGAPMVATVRFGRLDTVRAVLRGLHDRHVTPVVAVQRPGSATSTTAVVPTAFRRIAFTQSPDLTTSAWSRLTPAPSPPLRLTGTGLSLRARSTISGRDPVDLRIVVLERDGTLTPVTLGRLPRTGTATLRADVPCSAGCTVTRLGFSADPAAAVPAVSARGAVLLDRARVIGGSTSFPGPASGWLGTRERGSGSVHASDRDGGLMLRVDVDATEELLLSSRWAPPVLPTVVADAGHLRLPATRSGNRLDGTVITLRPVGSLPRVPGRDDPTTLVDLDLLQRTGRYDPGSALTTLWFDTERPSELARVRTALARRGVQLTPPTRYSAVHAAYDRSVPAWSLDLGVLVAIAALLIAVLMLVLVGATTWRARARDLAVLQMSGLPPPACARIAVLEQLPAVLVAGLVGVACGVVGARVALARVPLFPRRPAVSTLDLSTPWWLVGLSGVLCLAILGLTAALTGRYAARRAGPDRVRQTW